MDEDLSLSFDNVNYTPVPGFDFDYDKQLTLLKSVTSPYQSPTNYLKGCKWSPDGSCFLTNSEDKILRIFNLPHDIYSTPLDLIVGDDQQQQQSDMLPVLEMKTSELVYDYNWFPLMNSMDPSSCFFLTTSRDNPIHLWDAYTGQIVAVYSPYNHLDELISAYSVAFSPDGEKIYAGFKKGIRVFHVRSPGKVCEERLTHGVGGQHGIISCITVNPVRRDIYAVGSYSKQIGLYEEPTGDPICILEGQRGGLTHLTFSPDGTKLFSGGRRDGEILCWDMRKLSSILFTLKRTVITHQRIYFDISSNGNCLVSGGDDGHVTFWNLDDKDEQSTNGFLDPVKKFKAHNESVNGVSLHPSLPLMVTSSGQRRLPIATDSDDEDHHFISKPVDNCDNSIKIWMIPIIRNEEEIHHQNPDSISEETTNQLGTIEPNLSG
ncbi:LOW QUALITY PROTEIN: telomerase Cajal body protein 1-like [Panonychus citri]|uniref:LOW QUALITY PROTEIN: telomerase Cajal body protein 1-like n=1 Tax=Panonychus citri TaxID=50023 RepID=UPI002307CFC3|nr:LOW QUALITY PROTEIN: telomerase Cajal body protein 1-like [Panonychus citri]